MAGQMDMIIRGGTVVTPGLEGQLDIGISDGEVAQLGGAMTASTEIDASGRYVLPGGIDAHVHLTPPGTDPGSWSWVDDFEVGTRAAAAGGVTTVGNMSFPRTGEQMLDGLARDLADAEANAVVDYFQHAVLLDPNDEGVAQIEELAAAGHPSIKVFLSFRRFDRHVDGYLRAMTAAAAAGSVVLVHCEDPAVMHCCGTALTEAGHTEARYYPQTRPIEAERIATERAVGYCATTGAATYVVHLSSRAALDACRGGQRRGLPVYVETRPIYLYFTEERFEEPDGAKYTGAPPLRTADDVEAMWAGLNDGSVATVCTDHAPWTLADKLDPEVPAQHLRQGLAELEVLMPVLWSEGVAKGRLSVARFVEVTSTRAARLFGLYPRKGTISPGADADLVVWDPTATRVVDGATMYSNAGFTLYDGWEVTGWPELTISRGEIVARLAPDSTPVVEADPGRGRLAPRKRFQRP
ncbi:MAG: amidohydrolase family protein [Actinomycetia bacterium]|nr:amidohydrolase family protein [Actinomycetes bacterium]MCP5030793.1 amidohydrolase family protein [Actinomycetes bacterium]